MNYKPGDLVYYNNSENQLTPVLLLKKCKKNKNPLLEMWDVYDVTLKKNSKIIKRIAKYFILIEELGLD